MTLIQKASNGRSVLLCQLFVPGQQCIIQISEEYFFMEMTSCSSVSGFQCITGPKDCQTTRRIRKKLTPDKKRRGAGL